MTKAFITYLQNKKRRDARIARQYSHALQHKTADCL